VECTLNVEGLVFLPQTLPLPCQVERRARRMIISCHRQNEGRGRIGDRAVCTVQLNPNKGEYYSCPAWFILKFLGLQDSGMEKYLSTNLVAELHFYYLKNGIQF